jgi:hypothetical protein
MKWIKSSDTPPPKDRPFMGYDKEYDVIDIYNYKPLLGSIKNIIAPERYESVGSCDGCQHVLLENMTHWMELPQLPQSEDIKKKYDDEVD